jgi:hypothetical protein
MVALMVESGGACVWREFWSQAVGFVLVRSAGSRHGDVFTFNLFYKNIYNLCTFNVICKDNAVNFITFQHNKGSFPSILTGHTLR